jgi:plastocyanin
MRAGMAWAMALAGAAAGCGSGMGGYGGSGGMAAPAPTAACTAASATPLTNRTVTIVGMSYSPACASVPAGTLVTFMNTDTVYSPHTVTSDAGQTDTFDSGPLQAGDHFQHAFTTAGTEHIHCTYHVAMGMRMTVIVQ